MSSLVLIALFCKLSFKIFDFFVKLSLPLICFELEFLSHYLSNFPRFFIVALLHFEFEIINLLDEIIPLLPYFLFVPLLDFNFLSLQGSLKL